MRWAWAALFVLVLARGIAAAQDELVLEADRILYDTTARTLEATGDVRIRYRDVRLRAEEARADLNRGEILVRGRVVLEQAGRRLAAQSLRYDLRTGRATVTGMRGVLDGIYYAAREATLQGNVLRALEALATVCDPAAPLLRITAQRILLVPGERLVAEGASLWGGQARLVHLGRVEIPLGERPLERLAEHLPRPEAGYEAASGPWVALRYPYRAGDLVGEAYLRYNASLGWEGNGRLRYPAWGLELVAGTLRDEENRLYDALQLQYASQAVRLSSSAALHATFLAGTYRERATGAEAPKIEGALRLVAEPLRILPRALLDLTASLRAALYPDRSLVVPTVRLGLARPLDERSTVMASYTRTDLLGRSPFLFDVPDRTEEVFLGYAYRTPAFHASAGVAYDLVPGHLKLRADGGAEMWRGWEIRVSGVYNATLSAFEDLDIRVGTRCDCLSVSVTYRVARKEVFLGFALRPSPALPAAAPLPLE
ncbi:MAG: hypothetical protein QN193_05045 [Armatimonadota bacterium]|nr:hypothetical protein [Armatimonadota bacterium]MDR7443288.1 hypothetical protein [Armatimonadota bacterium]MDR7569955.1 hypothetical protein [Armatimonadota bacterium]MDR7614382.1 hypothetical protein [Armatimonadota bacterium]